MSNKLFVVFAALCAVLLATQTASCEDVDVQQPDQLDFPEPGSAFSFIVTDPNSPIPSMNSDQNKLQCHPKLCKCVCKCAWGYPHGRCNSRGACVCSR